MPSPPRELAQTAAAGAEPEQILELIMGSDQALHQTMDLMAAPDAITDPDWKIAALANGFI